MLTTTFALAFASLAFAQTYNTSVQLNGTATGSVTPRITTIVVPSPVFETATVTVTFEGSTYTTTYASYAGTPPPTPAAQPVTHKVTVGDNGALAFNPTNITASVNDTVEFTFFPKNHTVTQSNFLKPCATLENSTGVAGFDSGFNPVAANATSNTTFSFTVNSTAPIWVYCRQTSHCPSGMVFAVNAVADGPNNFSAFQALALTSNATNSSSTSSVASTGAATGTSTSISTVTSTSSPSASAGAGGAISAAISSPTANPGWVGILAIVGLVSLAL